MNLHGLVEKLYGLIVDDLWCIFSVFLTSISSNMSNLFFGTKTKKLSFVLNDVISYGELSLIESLLFRLFLICESNEINDLYDSR